MKTALIASLFAATALLAAPASADHRYAGHYGYGKHYKHHRYGGYGKYHHRYGRYYGKPYRHHRYGHAHRYYRGYHRGYHYKHHDDYAAYAIGGLLLGAMLVDSSSIN